MTDWTQKYFTEEELEKIKAALAEVETRTCGELMITMREKRKLLEKLYQHRELAVKDFEALGLANTKNKSGIMLSIIFEDRYFDILADEGIYSKIPDSVWNEMEERLKGEFRAENYFNGIMHIIETMGNILERECPVQDDDTDEIRNELTIK
jgi:uncharacterized membrane protein